MNTTGRSRASEMLLKTRRGSHCSSALAASAGSRHTSIRRQLNACRPTCSVYATSAKLMSGFCLIWLARLAVAVASACSVFRSEHEHPATAERLPTDVQRVCHVGQVNVGILSDMVSEVSGGGRKRVLRL